MEENWRGTKQIGETARMVNKAKGIRELISWLSDKIKRIALVRPIKTEEREETPNAQELLEEVKAKFGKQNIDTRQHDEDERGA